MNNKIIKVLNIFESNGYEAYIIGGFVRDNILGRVTYDVDICTNALPMSTKSLFAIKMTNNYGSVKFSDGKFNFDIATYRKEYNYSNNKPSKIEYINNLLEDLKRRDFTINTLLMNKNGDVIDLLGSIKDIQNKKIRCISNPDIKFKEDPTRILRALRFKIILDFSLERNTLKSIKKNKELLRTIPKEIIKKELDKILTSKYAIKGLKYLNILGVLKILNISYTNLIDCQDLCGMYAQLSLPSNYPFSKKEISNIKIIKKIVSHGKIDEVILFNYGLYLSQVAGIILKENIVNIIKKYNELPIYDIKDIKITSKEIMKILNIKPSKLLKIVYNDLVSAILNGEILNEKNVIIDYLLNRKDLYNGQINDFITI